MDIDFLEKLTRDTPGSRLELRFGNKYFGGEWYGRWNLDVHLGPGPCILASPWKGFDTINEALHDMSEQLTSYLPEQKK